MTNLQKIISSKPLEMAAIVGRWQAEIRDNPEPMNGFEQPLISSLAGTCHSYPRGVVNYRSRLVAEQLKAGNYSAAISVYGEPYRPAALMQLHAEGVLSPEQFASILRHIWIQADEPGLALADYILAFAMDTDRLVMTPEEKQAFDELPGDEITIYRGVSKPGDNGLGWFLQPELARRLSAIKGSEYYLQATISKDDVAAVMDARGYREIVTRTPPDWPARLELDAGGLQ